MKKIQKNKTKPDKNWPVIYMSHASKLNFKDTQLQNVEELNSIGGNKRQVNFRHVNTAFSKYSRYICICLQMLTKTCSVYVRPITKSRILIKEEEVLIHC